VVGSLRPAAPQREDPAPADDADGNDTGVNLIRTAITVKRLAGLFLKNPVFTPDSLPYPRESAPTTPRHTGLDYRFLK